MRFVRSSIPIALLYIVAMAVSPGFAQSPSETSNDGTTTQSGTSSAWRFYVAPSVFGAGMTGNLTTGGNTYAINPTLSDLTDNLQFGPFLTFYGQKAEWGFVADVGLATFGYRVLVVACERGKGLVAAKARHVFRLKTRAAEPMRFHPIPDVVPLIPEYMSAPFLVFH